MKNSKSKSAVSIKSLQQMDFTVIHPFSINVTTNQSKEYHMGRIIAERRYEAWKERRKNIIKRILKFRRTKKYDKN